MLVPSRSSAPSVGRSARCSSRRTARRRRRRRFRRTRSASTPFNPPPIAAAGAFGVGVGARPSAPRGLAPPAQGGAHFVRAGAGLGASRRGASAFRPTRLATLGGGRRYAPGRGGSLRLPRWAHSASLAGGPSPSPRRGALPPPREALGLWPRGRTRSARRGARDFARAKSRPLTLVGGGACDLPGRVDPPPLPNHPKQWRGRSAQLRIEFVEHRVGYVTEPPGHVQTVARLDQRRPCGTQKLQRLPGVVACSSFNDVGRAENAARRNCDVNS